VINAVRSIEHFFPWGDRLLIDDGSTDPRTRQHLEDIRRLPNWRITVMDRVAGRSYGGFYRNMRYALELALAEGYDYCFFFEDDEQLLWKKGDYPEYVEHLFRTCPDAIQVQPLFFRRIFSYSNMIEYIDGARAYRTDRGFSTTAIWNLETVRKHPDYKFACQYGDDLPANSAYWMRKGYRLYFQFDPTVAVIPWIQSNSEASSVASRNGNAASSKSSGLIIPPLKDFEVRFLQERDPGLVAYQEYFMYQKGQGVTPIWHQQGQNMNRFYQLCRITVDEEDEIGQTPVMVSRIPMWRPTTIPPLQSHLDWRKSPAVQTASRWRTLVQTAAARLPKTVLEWRHFSIRDYLGYMKLKSRLRREIEHLPFR
jgi:hypothetical protein